MYSVFGLTLPEAYHDALIQLDENWEEEVPCPDYNTYCREIPITIHVKKPFREPMISKCGIFDPESLQQYVMEVKDGILDFMVGATENSWEYTYHQRIGNQLDFVVDELKRNPFSRRAVVDIRDNEVDQNTIHPACLQHMQFTIRNGKLNLYVLMRSNDAVRATFMNMFAFIMLQKQVADKLEIEVGEYTHSVNCFHVYRESYETLDRFVERICASENEPAYNYIGEWNCLMQKEIPNIEKKVEAQRKKYIK